VARTTSRSDAARARRSRGGNPLHLRGLDELLAHPGRSGDIELPIEELCPDHMGMVEELQWDEVLRGAPLRPRYGADPGALTQLEKAREGRSVPDPIDGDER
jgi:hypothetical protein